MKLFSQNCAGLVAFLEKHPTAFDMFADCDVILIQELRVSAGDSARLKPVLKSFATLGFPFHAVSWAEKGIGGSITFSKTRLTVLTLGDTQQDVQQSTQQDAKQSALLTTHTKVEGVHYVITNCYIPNYGNTGDGKAKLDFIKESKTLFPELLSRCAKNTVVIFAGDFNATLDSKNCKRKGKPGCLPVEVEWIQSLVAEPLSLSPGEFTAEVIGPKGEFFTYYSFRGRPSIPLGTPRDVPLGSMTLDYILTTPNATAETKVLNTITTRDHFPLVSVVTPNEVTPNEVTPNEVTPNEATPH